MSGDTTTAAAAGAVRVGIVGCGIGGISTALALARKGIASHVFERAPEIGEVGAGLQVGPNAVRILRDLGVTPFLEVAAVLPDRAVMKDIVTGEEIIQIDFTDFPERYGAPYQVMHRGDLLMGLLKAATSTGLVTVSPGKELVELTQADESVTAIFADGTRYPFEVLLGADGIRSKVRQLLGDPEPPLASQYVIYRGTFPRTAEFENAVTLQTGEGHHVMHYPIRGGEMMNLVCSFKSEAAAPGADDWGTEAELEAAFADANPVVRTAIAQLDRSKRWVQFDRLPQRGWADGRVLRIGDAAHPTHQYFAQGACQAMEDAVTLADLFSAHQDDLVAQLAAFERARYDRAAAVTLGSRFWGELTHVGGQERMARDALLRQLGPDAVRRLDWLYGSRQLPIPDIPPTHERYEVLASERVATGGAR